MPISRALLNRLRLPYKALDIQGSKGDVLYIPDDVGVDLSVMHGMYNGDMVPVKTDANGIVSVVIDDSGNTGKGKRQYQVIKSVEATHILQHIDIDTSQFTNYMLIAMIESFTDNSAVLTITYDAFINNIIVSSLTGVSVTTDTNGVVLAILDLYTSSICTDVTRVSYRINNVGQTAVFSVYAVGWN